MKKTIRTLVIAAAAAVISGCATGQVGTDVENVDSSAIKNAGYDAAASTLVVIFENKQAYKFLDVPADVYDALMNAESKGQYFNTKINGLYPYETVE